MRLKNSGNSIPGYPLVTCKPLCSLSQPAGKPDKKKLSTQKRLRYNGVRQGAGGKESIVSIPFFIHHQPTESKSSGALMGSMAGKPLLPVVNPPADCIDWAPILSSGSAAGCIGANGPITIGPTNAA